MQWIRAEYPGVRYYKHDTRKHGVQYDKYFSGSYQVAGKRYTMGFGWSSEGWTAQNCHDLLMQFKKNCKLGQGPKTLKEKKELEKQKEEIKQEQDKLAKKEEITINKFFEDHYLSHQNGKSELSITNEKMLVNRWVKPVIGDTKLKDVEIKDLIKMRSNMEKEKKSERTIQYVLTVIRQIYNLAIDLNYYSGHNPVSKIKFRKLNNERVRYLTKDEADKLLNKIKKEDHQLYVMSLLSLHCGLRWGEIAALTRHDINFQNKTIKVMNPKNNRTRYVYMTQKVISELSSINMNNGLIFKNKQGEKYPKVPKAYRRIVNDLGLNDGVENDRDKVVFHTLRHTFASWQVQAGMSLYELKELLGHSSLDMVMRYAHLAPDNASKATAIFDNGEY